MDSVWRQMKVIKLIWKIIRHIVTFFVGFGEQ